MALLDKNLIKKYLNINYSQEYVNKKRKLIYDIISEKLDRKVNRIDCYRNKDVEDIARLYDQHFFDSNIFKTIKEYEEEGATFKFIIEDVINGPRSDASGFTGVIKKSQTLFLSINKAHLRKTFIDRNKRVSGSYICYDRLECIQQTIEHELLHVFMFLFDNDTFFDDPHGKTFKQLNRSVFKVFSTSSYLGEDVHIYTGRGKDVKKGLKVGKEALFLSQGGKFKKVKIIKLPSDEELELDEEAIVTIKEGKITKEIPITFLESLERSKKKQKLVSKNTILSPISLKHSKT